MFTSSGSVLRASRQTRMAAPIWPSMSSVKALTSQPASSMRLSSVVYTPQPPVSESSIQRFTQVGERSKLGPAEGEATFCALIVESDDATRLAVRAEPVRLGGRLSAALPEPTAA